MFDYATLRKTAAGLIKNFGAEAVITRDVGRRYNPTSGSLYTGVINELKLKAVRSQYGQFEKSTMSIQAGDIKLLVEAGLGEPLIDDNLLFDGINYRVMQVNITSPSGTDVFYELHLRP